MLKTARGHFCGGFILIQIKGIFAEAHIMCNQELEGSIVDQYALAQVQIICDNKAAEGSVIRVMPDVHPGKVGPIGLAIKLGGRG